ncbi:MAG: di-trans,poly-cis-decaprenylcistransferase [Methanobacterium sp.]|nr:di-trans,poly-cis-decaprenylcistransferase [Methanobacterium sp.]
MQSDCDYKEPFHVAIIMDGNGRWATRRGLPRTAGHSAGVATVRRLIEAIPAMGVSTLTLFAFSSDNWRRPADEVGALMVLLRTYLRSEARRFIENDMRLSVIGRRDRLPAGLVRQIEEVEHATASGRRLHVRVALDYSSRDAILQAAVQLGSVDKPSREHFGKLVSKAREGDAASPEVDLLIRTGGEKRLSDFLLWESAYAELWFSEKMWPDFGTEDLQASIAEFRRRDRRFGGLSNVA